MTEAIPCLFNGQGGMLPLEPMLAIILSDATLARNDRPDDRGMPNGRTMNLQRLAERVEIDEKVLRRLTSGTATQIALDTADRYLCATGRHLRDVYPWLYSPEQIAADIDAIENECPIKKAHRVRERARSLARRERWKALTS